MTGQGERNMAYAQPRYEGAPSRAHARIETSYEPQQHQDYAVHHHGNGYQNYDSYHEHMSRPEQHQSDNYHAPHGISGTGNGYYGGIAHLDASGPPGNPYPQVGMQRGTQRPHAQVNRRREESSWKDGPIQPDEGYHRNDHYYEPCEDQSYRPRQPRIAISKSVDAISQPPQSTVQFQQHGNPQSHGYSVPQGGTVNHRPGSAPKPASSHAQRQPAPPKPAASQPPKRQSLLSPNHQIFVLAFAD